MKFAYLKNSLLSAAIALMLPCAVGASLDVYPVVRSDVAAATGMFESPCTAGVTFYFGWSKVEPQRGRYEFSDLEKVLVAAEKSGKKVNLALLPGRWSPSWLFETLSNQTMWRHSDTYVGQAKAQESRAVVPWDSNFHAEFKSTINSLAKVVGKHRSAINSIAITGGSNTNGIEMNFIGSDEELKRVGFSADRYIASWQDFVDAYAEAFPGIQLTLAVHTMYGSKRTDSISKEIISYARKRLGERLRLAALAFTEEGWFKPGNQYADLVLKEPPSEKPVFQAIRIYSQNNRPVDFSKMFAYAKKLDPAWLEVWAEDVKSGYLSCDARAGK